ncbi:MAG: TRAP transporter substrate-binding protein DctP [Deltaproteobacteria bacterium]|nr:TRAP transporter substrate-binding protein DctP [Deltaproteobacteria bacterium]
MRFSAFVLLAMLSVHASRADADPRDPVILRVGTQAIDGSRYMKDILALGKEIEKRTRGSVQLDWVSGGQLGDEAVMAALIASGKLDGGGLSETGLIALVPEMAMWRTPGLVRTYEEVDRATAAADGSVRELFATQGLTFAMWADLGFAHVFSTAPITSLRAVLDKAERWIASPLDGALTQAISSRRARAWAMPPLYMLAIGSAHVQAMSNLRHHYVIGGLVFSRAAWSRLTAADQKTVLAVCREREPRIRASWRKESERGVAALRKSGVAINGATDAELTAFAGAAETGRKALAKGDLGAKVLRAIDAP